MKRGWQAISFSSHAFILLSRRRLLLYFHFFSSHIALFTYLWEGSDVAVSFGRIVA